MRDPAGRACQRVLTSTGAQTSTHVFLVKWVVNYTVWYSCNTTLNLTEHLKWRAEGAAKESLVKEMLIMPMGGEGNDGTDSLAMCVKTKDIDCKMREVHTIESSKEK